MTVTITDADTGGGIVPARTFVALISPPAEPSPEAWWFMFRGGAMLVRATSETVAVPLVAGNTSVGVTPLRPPDYLGTLHGVDCWAAEADAEGDAPDGCAWEPLRGLYGRISDDHFAIAGRAVQIVAWGRTHRFCGQCGTPTEPLPGERATRCPRCGLTNYPRLSPAVIVRVRRGDEILLARSRAFPAAFYSVLAGFVEPGESLEETVRREIAEEVGIAVTDIRYFGSQPWPFPNSLMIGFTATYIAGKVEADGVELLDARWFRPDDLPRIPPPPSIARRLIDDFAATVAARAAETATHGA